MTTDDQPTETTNADVCPACAGTASVQLTETPQRWVVVVGADPHDPDEVHGPYDDARVALRVAMDANAGRPPGIVWARIAAAADVIPPG